MTTLGVARPYTPRVRMRWIHVSALVAIAMAVTSALAYPSTTLHCITIDCPDTILHRVPLRVAIIVLGLGAALVLELIGRRGLPALPYAGAIMAVALGAFVPLWLWSGEWGCFSREAAALRCQAGWGMAAALTGLVLALGLVQVGRGARRSSHGKGHTTEASV